MYTTFEIETAGMREDAERKGEKRGKLETALSMLKEGLDMSLIQKVTGLKEQQVLNYQRELSKN